VQKYSYAKQFNLTSSIQVYNLDKPIAECPSILDCAAAKDGGHGGMTTAGWYVRQKPVGGSKAGGLPHHSLSPFPPLPFPFPRSSEGEFPGFPPLQIQPWATVNSSQPAHAPTLVFWPHAIPPQWTTNMELQSTSRS